jgi:hypothetical protein
MMLFGRAKSRSGGPARTRERTRGQPGNQFAAIRPRSGRTIESFVNHSLAIGSSDELADVLHVEVHDLVRAERLACAATSANWMTARAANSKKIGAVAVATNGMPDTSRLCRGPKCDLANLQTLCLRATSWPLRNLRRREARRSAHS